MLPKITELELNVQNVNADLPKTGKSFLFDFKKGEFVFRNGKMIVLKGKDALKMFIEKALRTQRHRYEIYKGTEYGVMTEDLIGTNYPRDFITAELKREITESLIKHPDINNLTNWQIEREGSILKVLFTVDSIYGLVDQEVRFNV